MHFDAIQISDLHLGAKNSETKKIRRFLQDIKKNKHISTDLLILNGDGLNSPKIEKLRKKDWKILKLLKKISKNTRVIWVVGNHDPDIEVISDYFGIEAVEEIVFKSGGKSILASHGHRYDVFLDKHPVLTVVADAIYNLSQMVDGSHRLAKILKKKSKAFIECSSRVSLGAACAAKEKSCSAAWHGHTHKAGHIHFEGVDVFDGGCWTERPCSFLVIKNGATEIRWKSHK